MKKIVILLLMFFSSFIVCLNVNASNDDNVFNDNSSIESDFNNLGMDISIYQPYYLLEDEEYKKPYVVAFSEYYVDEHYLKNYIYLYVAKYDVNIFGDDNDYKNSSEGTITFTMNGNKYNSAWTICKTDYNHNLIKMKIDTALFYDSTCISRLYDFESIKIINSKLIDDSYENVYDDTEYNFDLDFNGEVNSNDNIVIFKYDTFAIIDERACYSSSIIDSSKANFQNFLDFFGAKISTANEQFFILTFNLPNFIKNDIDKLLSIDIFYNISRVYLEPMNDDEKYKEEEMLKADINDIGREYSILYTEKVNKSIYYYEVDENGDYILDNSGNKRRGFYTSEKGFTTNNISSSIDDFIDKDTFIQYVGNEDNYNELKSYDFTILFDVRSWEIEYFYLPLYSSIDDLLCYCVDDLFISSFEYENLSGELVNCKVNSGSGISNEPILPDLDDFDLLDFLLQILDWIINHPYETLAIILCVIFLPTILAIISSLSPSLFSSIVSIVKILFKILLYPIIFILKLLWKIIVKIFKPSKKDKSTKKIKKKKNKKYDSSLSYRSKL